MIKESKFQYKFIVYVNDCLILNELSASPVVIILLYLSSLLTHYNAIYLSRLEEISKLFTVYRY